MKRKAFGYSFIFLVIFQLFSPWMVNVAYAQTTEIFTPEPRIGYIKDHKTISGGKEVILPGVVFMYVDTLESSKECYNSDINFYIYKVNPRGLDWQSWDETVDSTSDCNSNSSEWHTKKIETNQGTTKRHFYGTDINGFNRKIAIEYDLFNKNIIVNEDKKYGNDTEEIFISKDTKSFGPTVPADILKIMDGTADGISENSLNGAFDVSISPKSYLSEIDQTKIVGEFNIKIQNKGAKWQDSATKIGIANSDDDFGAWDSVYDEELLNGDAGLAKDITPDKDGATGRFNSFDGFIFDISTDKDFKGEKTMSINLNKLILEGKQNDVLPLFDAGDINLKIVTGFEEGKSLIAEPEKSIELVNGLDEQAIYHYRVRIYPDNLREGLGGESLGIPEDAYIVAEGTRSIKAKSELEIIQDSRSGSTLEKASGQQSELPWMPTCGLGFWPASDGSISGCIVQVFYYLIYVPTAALLAIAGSIMDWVLEYSISPGVYKVGYIVDGWRFIRDFCNLFFIFMLIYLAFKIILGVGSNAKQMVVNTLIIATVINFSYPLTTVVIDISNITARQLYYNSFNKKGSDGKPIGLSTMVASGFNPQKLIAGAGAQGKTKEERDNNKGAIFMIILMGVAFNIVAMILFLKIALQFVYRILGLVFAIILSPFALFSYSLDEKQRGKLSMVGFEAWMSGLLSDAFKAPVFLFLILILALFVGNKPFDGLFGNSVTGIEWWMSMIIPFLMIVGFLTLISKITKSMSSGLADMAGSAVMKGVGAVAGVALGGAALAGSGLLGKAATKFAGSSMGQRIMDKAAGGKGVSGWVARQQAKLIRKTQSGSFDLRQTGLGNAVSKEAGMNFNLAAGAIGLGTASAVGGYVGTVERRNKKREEFVQMLEWNKKLAEEMDHKKKGTEKEKESQEDQLAKEKKLLSEQEQKLSNKEKEKTETDKLYSLIEELEKLRAKEQDLIAENKQTGEVRAQQNQLEEKILNGLNEAQRTQIGGTVAGANLANAKTLVKDDKEEKNRQAKELKDNALETNPDGTIRGGGVDALKTQVREREENIRELDKSIKALTKAIENIKNNRKNMYAHRIRNKSGHIYKKETYTQKQGAEGRMVDKTPEEIAKFNSTFGDMSDKMKNIVTSVDEHSHEANNAFTARVIATNTALGALAGAFTGGIGAIAMGVATGGIVGIARSYRPDNEHYGVPHDKDEWHPHSEDTYKPGEGKTNKPKPSGGGDSHAGGH